MFLVLPSSPPTSLLWVFIYFSFFLTKLQTNVLALFHMKFDLLSIVYILHFSRLTKITFSHLFAFPFLILSLLYNAFFFSYIFPTSLSTNLSVIPLLVVVVVVVHGWRGGMVRVTCIWRVTAHFFPPTFHEGTRRWNWASRRWRCQAAVSDSTPSLNLHKTLSAPQLPTYACLPPLHYHSVLMDKHLYMPTVIQPDMDFSGQCSRLLTQRRVWVYESEKEKAWDTRLMDEPCPAFFHEGENVPAISLVDMRCRGELEEGYGSGYWAASQWKMTTRVLRRKREAGITKH